jgi:hypothetical protein
MPPSVVHARSGFADRSSVVRETVLQGTRTRYEVTVGEVEALRAYVSEQARADEAEAAERLLGQLAALGNHQDGNGAAQTLTFSPVPAARALAARAMDALRSEGEVRMGSRRWRLQRTTASRASKRRLAPGRSPGDDAS